MSQQQNEQEGIRMMDLLKESIYKNHPEWKLKEMSQQEKIQEKMKVVYPIKKRYLVLQQQKQNFQDMIQQVEQLNKAKEQLQQAKKQLQQEKKQLQPIQDQFKLIYNQKHQFNLDFDYMMLNVFQNLKPE